MLTRYFLRNVAVLLLALLFNAGYSQMSIEFEIGIAGITDLSDHNSRGPTQLNFVLLEAPVANDDFVEVDEDNNIEIFAFSNDTDGDGNLDNTSITIISGPSFGQATVDPATGIITYEPELNFFGIDKIIYQISDTDAFGPVSSATAEITITVNPVNDAPTSADQTVSTDEDITYTFKDEDFIYNDVDGDCFNGFKIVTPLTVDLGELFYDGADIVLNQVYADPTSLTFVPHPGQSGITEFDFKVEDDQGAESIPYTMTIVINDVNDLPASAGLEVTTDMNVPYLFTEEEFSFTDPDDDAFGEFQIVRLPAKGQLLYEDIAVLPNTGYADFSLLSFEPSTDQFGSPYTDFDFIVVDDRGGESESYTVIVNVIPDADFELIISQGFSPNNDNINDFWYIEGLQFYAGNIVQIYNRWGTLIRTIKGYDNESRMWWGTTGDYAAGTPVPDGSYFFVINLGDGTKAIQGYVVLNR